MIPTNIQERYLNTLSVKTLLAIAKAAGGIGFDPFKDERTKAKTSLVSFMLSKFAPSALTTAHHAVLGVFLGEAIDKAGFADPVAPAVHPAIVAPEIIAAAQAAHVNHFAAPTPIETPAMTPAATPAAPVANDVASQIGALFATMAASSVNEATVRGIVNTAVADAIKSQAPRVIEVRQPAAAPVQLEGRQHPLFDKVLKLAASGVNVMLVGPAGCGKTYLAHQIAKALNLPFSSISGSAGASESQLLGRLLPTGEGGKFEYHESPFVRTYEGGGCFLFDEIDAFDPNMLLVVNQATANGGFTVEARTNKQYVARHEKTVMIASANTWGTGASAMYVGRSQLDAATLDRYYIVPMDYDTVLEAQFGPADLVAWVHGIRAKAQTAGLRRVVSTRMIQKGAAALGAGLKLAEVKADLLAGWSKDELAKVGA